MSRFSVLCVVLTLFAMAATAPAEIIVNGDFENTVGWGAPGTVNSPANWPPTPGLNRKNPAAQQSGVNAIGGSGTSAFMESHVASEGDRRDILQVDEANPIGPQWVMQFDFAAEDPGVDGTRSLSGAIEITNGNRVTFRVTDVNNDGIGDFQIHDGSAWRQILANAVEFDADVTTTPVVNHIAFLGRFDEPTPVYDITITNGLSGGVFTATGVGYYSYSLAAKPATGAEGVGFNTFNSVGDFVIDNVSLAEVPEPGTVSLILAGIICLFVSARRRRRG